VHSTARFHVDILRMLAANLRLVTTPVDQPLTYTRAWCYQRPLVEVVLAAVALDPDGDDEPVGWIKQVGTERRACGWLRQSSCRSMPASTRSARTAATQPLLKLTGHRGAGHGECSGERSGRPQGSVLALVGRGAVALVERATVGGCSCPPVTACRAADDPR
jgi:hypothetical protein